MMHHYPYADARAGAIDNVADDAAYHADVPADTPRHEIVALLDSELVTADVASAVGGLADETNRFTPPK